MTKEDYPLHYVYWHAASAAFYLLRVLKVEEVEIWYAQHSRLNLSTLKEDLLKILISLGLASENTNLSYQEI